MADSNEEQHDNEARFAESFEPIQEVDIHAPIVGYEVVEARKRFTVYQINVQLGGEKSWHVFRRYSDFIRMDEGLRKLFSNFQGVLPPKRYFGDNFNSDFIEMRKRGLQEYINNALVRQDTLTSQPVVEFFCFDDPPGPYDSLEESRAFIESLEDTVNEMRSKQNELESEIRLVKSHLRQAWVQKHALLIALRSERVLNGKPSYDNDDAQLMAEYSRLPEVARLDFNPFSRSTLRLDEGYSRGKHLRTNRFPTSTAASQWDLTVETAEGLAKKSPSLKDRRARSTSDLTQTRNHRRRNTSHLPAAGESRGNLTLLGKFFTQSTEALQHIRNSVRQKLEPSKEETAIPGES